MKSTIRSGWIYKDKPLRAKICLFGVCVRTHMCTGKFMHRHICGGRRTAFQELGLLPIYNSVSLVSAVTAYVHSQPIPLSPLLSPHESARVMAVSHQIQLFILWVALLKLGASGMCIRHYTRWCLTGPQDLSKQPLVEANITRHQA